jgi:GntR family transcriptional regulator
VPEPVRSEPLHIQIANHYRDLIVNGEMPSGAQMPAMRAIAEEWGVALQTAQRAVDHLKTAKLVHTSNQGTVVNGARIKRTPTEWIKSVKRGHPLHLRTEAVNVTAAGLVTAQEYISDLLGLPAGGDVIRREQVFYDPGTAPAMLLVSWFQPHLAEAAPELLLAEGIPSTGGEIGLILERTGRSVTYGEDYCEARGILDDGRESPLMRLPVGSMCLGGVYTWFDQADILEYGEFVLPPKTPVGHSQTWE